MNCPKCNNEIKKGVAFCTECGSKIEIKEEFIFCEECGSKLEKGSLFCTECGIKVGETPKKEEKKETKKETKKEIKKDVVLCSECGAELEKGSTFCTECGIKVGDLKNGASVTTELTEGVHKVTISTIDKDTDQPIEVTKDRNNIEILTVAKMGLVAAKADIVDVIFK